MAIRQQLRLSSGVIATLRYPDLYAILAGVGSVPSPHELAVIDALTLEGSLALPQNMAEIERMRRLWIANYEIAAICLETPRLILRGEPGEGEIGPSEITAADAEAIRLVFFRYYDPAAFSPVADSDEPGGSAGTSRTGDDLSHDAERVSADRGPARGVGDRSSLSVGGTSSAKAKRSRRAATGRSNNATD